MLYKFVGTLNTSLYRFGKPDAEVNAYIKFVTKHGVGADVIGFTFTVAPDLCT